MQISLLLRQEIIKLFAIMLMGYLVVKAGLLKAAESKSISVILVYLAVVTPSCATVTSMAQLYNRDAAYSSTLYFLTTILSILSMPVMIYLYECVV